MTDEQEVERIVSAIVAMPKPIAVGEAGIRQVAVVAHSVMRAIEFEKQAQCESEACDPEGKPFNSGGQSCPANW